MSDVDGEDVYRAVLRLAFGDGSIAGEEMDWLRRTADLLELDKKVRRDIKADIQHQSRMGQLSGDDDPADVYRRLCDRAWKNDQIGSGEVEALEDLARAFGFDRARAEGILAGTASAGATVPDLVNVEGEGRPDSPPPGVAARSAEAAPSPAPGAGEPLDTPSEGPGFPVVEVLVVAAVLGGVAAMVVL